MQVRENELCELSLRVHEISTSTDNSSKETLIDIPYISCRYYQNKHNPSCPQTGQAYSNFKSYMRFSLSGSYSRNVTSSGKLLDV